ncbi:MAG: hypothetical protein ACPGSC_13720 [Granulosicoccaceae bacterium]
MSHENHHADEDKRWLDEPKNVNKLVYALAIVCALSVLADFVWHRHGHFSFEEFPGFYAFYGFVACCAVVFVAIGLRHLIMRDENYYD